jgi:putrescine aminotransferase
VNDEDERAIVDRYGRHVSPTFVRLLGVLGFGRVFVRGEGVHLFDSRGRRYLDALAGFGSANLGHAPPALSEAIAAQLAAKEPGILHVGPSASAARLGEALSRATRTDLAVSLLALSGAEAVDSAMKLARAATGRRGFVSCEGGYHGLDLGVLSVMGNKRIRSPFEPLLEHCARVPFGDAHALERALSSHEPAALIIEPVLGEGGAVLAPAGYLQRARELCDRHGTLLVFDEVQTGLGRTGTLFAFEREGVVPDVLAVGKALGGGLVPVSAAVTTRALYERAFGSMDRFDVHGSTYAGYAIGSAVACAMLDHCAKPKLLENVCAQGAALVEGLSARVGAHPMVRSVRGAGLMVAVELGSPREGLWQKLTAPLVDTVAEKVLGQWLCVKLLEAGVVAQPATQRWNVLKLTPPLTLEREHVETLVDCVGGILDDYPDPARVLRDAGLRVGEQALRGGAFR